MFADSDLFEELRYDGGEGRRQLIVLNEPKSTLEAGLIWRQSIPINY